MTFRRRPAAARTFFFSLRLSRISLLTLAAICMIVIWRLAAISEVLEAGGDPFSPLLEDQKLQPLFYNGTGIPVKVYQQSSPKNFCTPSPYKDEEYHPREDITIKDTGLLYLKSHKAASSTCEGINIKLARHFQNCRHENRHEYAESKRFANRDATQSFLWTMVRSPPKRDLSQVYHFRVSRTGMEPSDSNILEALDTRVKGTQTRFLWPTKSISVSSALVQKHPKIAKERIKSNIFDSMDFIGVVEHMSTSLAVLSLLLEVPASAVIVLTAKTSGGYDGGSNKMKCTYIQPAKETQGIKSYFASSKYRSSNPDLLLYDMAVESFEATVDHLGRSKVEQRRLEIEQLQHVANDKCLPQAIFPCSPHGDLQLEAAAESCYVQDAGCAWKCIDDALLLVDRSA